MDELTKKWVETGLLEGLSDAGKTILAMKMERLAQHMLANTFTSDVDLYVFPILRRACVERIDEIGGQVTYVYHGNVDPIFLLNDFSTWFNSSNCQDLMNDLGVHGGIDVEAEMCALYSEHYNDRFRRGSNDFKPLPYIPRHKL